MILRTKRTADIEKAVRAAIPQKAADRFPEIFCSGFRSPYGFLCVCTRILRPGILPRLYVLRSNKGKEGKNGFSKVF
jgi:hypothetical protein